MASGTPDYYQTVREVYGAAKSSNAVMVVTANAETEIISVSGKGIIYGGDISLNIITDQTNGVPILEVDGDKIAESNWIGLNSREVVKENSAGLYLLQYDDVGYIYTAGISRGITFETSFRILYDENDGDTPSVSSRVIFALI